MHTVYTIKNHPHQLMFYEKFQHGTCSSELHTPIQNDNLFVMLC